MTPPDDRRELSLWGANAVLGAYGAFTAEFRAITRRARSRFERRDWRGTQVDAAERLEVRAVHIRRSVEEIRARFVDAAQDRDLWAAMKATYSGLIAGRPDFELAETFFNSVTRRVFFTVGVDARIEFVASDFELPPPSRGGRLYRTYPRPPSSQSLVRAVLRDTRFDAAWEDPDRDARLAGEAIDRHLAGLEDGLGVDAVEVLDPVFYRNKGAYLVGRMRRGNLVTPVVLALLHDEGGIYVDAVVMRPNDVSSVFSFTRSYFQVDAERPHEVILFLKSILPQKRFSELYIATGHNKHGKTELYREILAHLSRSIDRFEAARGDRGMVMAVFTLPSLDIVFKVIRDRFAPPKSTTRDEVMAKYQLVFRHDRAGRLVDAQDFEHLVFERARFAPELLEELARECASSVAVRVGEVAIRHLYAERRVAPLNLFLRGADESSAREAVLDFGRAVKDLAATNTFPGDMLLKNFGVTRTGRVIFYDYDELCLLTDVNFRDLPPARGDDEEMSAEPWFYVGPNDVFPEEFLPFLGLPDGLRQAFLEAHGDLLTADWWRRIQERHRQGEVVDIFPYPEEERLRRPRG